MTRRFRVIIKYVAGKYLLQCARTRDASPTMSATLAVFHAPRAIPKIQRNNVVPRRRIGSPHQAEDPRRRAKRGDGKKRLGRPSDKSDDNGETSGRRQFLSGGLQLLILSSADDLLAAATAAYMSAPRPETVVYIGVTMDGYIARPDGSLDFLPQPEGDDDFGFGAFLNTVDAVVMGRRTFDQVAEFVARDKVPWPYEGKRVIVVSRTMTQKDVPEMLSSKVTVTAQSPSEALKALGKTGFTRRVYVDGGMTIRSLLEEDQVDEMVLTSVPVTIGRGTSLWGFDTKDKRDYKWSVTSSEPIGRGMVKTTFKRLRKK